jgi:hypothetical protein
MWLFDKMKKIREIFIMLFLFFGLIVFIIICLLIIQLFFRIYPISAIETLNVQII